MHLDIIAQNIRSIAKRKGLDVAKLAGHLGRGDHSIYRSMREGNLTIKDLLSLSELLEVSVMDFFRHPDADSPKNQSALADELDLAHAHIEHLEDQLKKLSDILKKYKSGL